MAYTTTVTHGKTFRFEKNDVAVDFTTDESLDATLDIADASRQGQHWKEGAAGMAGMTGSVGANLVLGNTEQKALHDNLITAVPGVLLTDLKFLINGSTEGWNGDFFVTGFAVTASIGDIVKVTIPVTLNGAPTLSDAQ